MFAIQVELLIVLSIVILEAMRKNDGDGCSMFEAHADLEIFRIRLGKALDYEYHEDYIGGYFSERGPRDTTALLDIERAFNKLEKVALMYRKRENKPLVLVINQTHLIRDNEDGKDLLELLQQRAEQVCGYAQVFLVSSSRSFGFSFHSYSSPESRMLILPPSSGLLPTSSL